METKPGLRTTEFWLAFGAQVAVLLDLTGAWNWAANADSGKFGAIVAAAYALARGIAKANVRPSSSPTPPAG